MNPAYYDSPNGSISDGDPAMSTADSGGAGGGFSSSQGLMGAGGILSIYGNLEAGNNQASLLNRQAGLQRQYANMALQAGNYNAYRQTILANRQIGSAVAGYGASGVDQSSGSVMAVLGASAANAELDRQNVIYGANVRAINYENQASLDEISAANAKQAGELGATGAGLQTAGQIATIAAFA